MSHEPLLQWTDVLGELVQFLAAFLATGAVGFRIASLPGLLVSAAPGEREFALAAGRRAARDGLAGAIITASLLIQNLPDLAARRHVTVAALLGQAPTQLQFGLLVAALVGFTIASFAPRPGLGWTLAAIGVLVAPFRFAFFGQFDRLVNPLHVLAGGLWIGTLGVMLFAGIRPALRELPPERRGPVVERLVRGFSPLALGAAALLVSMGVVTAWTHLKRLDALWTTPYGWTLIAKLCVVASVAGLGAWNWRRQKPRLGSADGAYALGRTASGEFALAMLVLVITSVLVSLPSPK